MARARQVAELYKLQKSNFLAIEVSVFSEFHVTLRQWGYCAYSAQRTYSRTRPSYSYVLRALSPLPLVQESEVNAISRFA